MRTGRGTGTGTDGKLTHEDTVMAAVLSPCLMQVHP